MYRIALGILSGCCVVAGPAAVAGAQGDPVPPPSTAFPKSVEVTVGDLDIVYGGNRASSNRIFCSPYDAAACAGSEVRVTLTLTAATAKAAGIAKREISSVVKTLPGNPAVSNFKHDLSSSETSKLKKLQKAKKQIKMVVAVSVTKGATTRKAPTQLLIVGAHHGRPYEFQVGEAVDYSGARG
ncbi:MAG: hypothetical protein JWM31_547 [Solirubrobacterales bacterium]|nr:hypothetical protein [Solirubrobacterales bacterium]